MNHYLGPCCGCGETKVGVRNIVMLGLRAPIAGHGWGCAVCDVPSDGAVAVFCDPCLDAFQRDPRLDGQGPLKFACRGYPTTEGRIPIARLTQSFKHKLSRHQEVCRSQR
jgi:hypothetical protein